jgi:prepilin-type N-terminal cleavage/methylation domain-containing protein
VKVIQNRRPAFTLVELLVAAGIIAMLLALVAISYPSINEREQLTRAVDKLRTGLLTARLWARRDNVVTGVRFYSSAPSATVAVYDRFDYVQQPLDNLSGIANVSAPTSLTVNLTSGSGSNPFGKIKPNQDYLVLDGDVPHLITSATSPSTLSLASAIQINPIGGVSTSYHPFRIVRGVEPIPLQEENGFGDRIFINPNNIYAPALPPLPLTPFIVSFLPSGQVFNSTANQIKFSLTQEPINPNDGNEIADVFLDCLSGTTRYINP